MAKSMNDLLREVLAKAGEDLKKVTVDQLVELTKSLTSDELDQLSAAIEKNKGSAKLEKLAESISSNLQKVIQLKLDEDDLEEVQELVEQFNDELEERIRSSGRGTTALARCIASDHLGEMKSYLAAAYEATDPEEERRILATRNIWKTQKGELVDVADMDDNHLLNSIQLLQRKAREWRERQPSPGDSSAQSILDAQEEYRRLAEMDDSELAYERYGHQYRMLVLEADHRGLVRVAS